MHRTVMFTGTAAEAGWLLARLPAVLSGVEPDAHGLTRMVYLRAANALLSQIRQDFIRKSHGERGRDGITWAPLKPETVAYNRRTTRVERKTFGIGKGPRPTLTPEQDRVWRETYARVLREMKLDAYLNPDAKGRAAAIAWSVVKEEMGAKTKLELLGGRKVDILRDTGELLRSFSPGIDDQPSGADGQIIDQGRGFVRVGSNAKPWHHTGDPARGLPARPFWPADGTIPPAWMPAVERAIVNGIAAVVVFLTTGGTSTPRDAT